MKVGERDRQADRDRGGVEKMRIMRGINRGKVRVNTRRRKQIENMKVGQRVKAICLKFGIIFVCTDTKGV